MALLYKPAVTVRKQLKKVEDSRKTRFEEKMQWGILVANRDGSVLLKVQDASVSSFVCK